MRRLAIFGSTGSIGTQALSLLDDLAGQVRLVGLSAGANAHLLAEQARRYRPDLVALADEAALSSGIDFADIPCLGGPGASARLLEHLEPDLALIAVAGAQGLNLYLQALRQGCRIALANKEALIAAGSWALEQAFKSGAEILPLDSEHAALHQILSREPEFQLGRKPVGVRRVVLTASGGPFRTATTEEMARATFAQAVRHPVWAMGEKISCDSATMMNKAFEIIAAHVLFGLAAEDIEVVVHPQAVVHGFVVFDDGRVLAQLAAPDMRVPIRAALCAPSFSPWREAALDITRLGTLSFSPWDAERFPAVSLGYEALRLGGTAGAVLVAASEVAVERFAKAELRLTDIAPLCADMLARAEIEPVITREAIDRSDRLTRGLARTWRAALS